VTSICSWSRWADWRLDLWFPKPQVAAGVRFDLLASAPALRTLRLHPPTGGFSTFTDAHATALR